MKASELKNRQVRRLNKVLHKDVIKSIDCIAPGQVILLEDRKTEESFGGWVDLDEVEFIPLTEEWLLKLGFKRRHDQKYYHTKFDRTWVSLDSILVKWYGNALGGIMMLDYVHQLQNIFYAINSEELELK